jgi:phosphoglycolate phosphatase
MKNDVKTIAVNWGYNSEKALLKFHPTHFVKNPNEILKICGVEE